MAEKKKRVKIPQENKIRAELQKEINSCCPFCKSIDIGHFEIHHINEDPSNNFTINLLLLCPTCHSKITKGDIIPIDVLNKKIELLSAKPNLESQAGKVINFNSKVNNAFVGDNNNISIKQSNKKTIQKYPLGCIGFDTIKANYIAHLIKRYNEYKEYEVGKSGMSYGLFGRQLKNKYKIAPTRTIYNVPIEKFEELFYLIQSKIDNTKLARVKGKNHKNYSTFEEYKKQVV